MAVGLRRDDVNDIFPAMGNSIWDVLALVKDKNTWHKLKQASAVPGHLKT
jgi:hypothetical protein